MEDYGAFVELQDLPGVTGLVHKSELSWDPVMTPESVVQKGGPACLTARCIVLDQIRLSCAGMPISVKVIDLDVKKAKISLSLKQTQPDPIKATLETVQWGSSLPVPEEITGLMERMVRCVFCFHLASRITARRPLPEEAAGR